MLKVFFLSLNALSLYANTVPSKMEIKHLSFTCDDKKEKAVQCFHGSLGPKERLYYVCLT